MLLWIVLAVLTAGAVLSVLVPMSRAPREGSAQAAGDTEVYRDQLLEVDRDVSRGVISEGEAEAARIEIGRRLLAADGTAAAAPARRLSGRTVAAAVVILVPGVALGLYLILGSPQLPGSPWAQGASVSSADQDLEGMIARVEEHLAEHPEDARGWEVIAPIYMRMGRAADAAAAWRKVIRLTEATPQRQADLAEALVSVEEGMVTQEALELFRKAAQEDPELAKPRFYLALAAEQDGRWLEAVEGWEQLLESSPPEAPWREAAEERLQAAREAMAGGDVPGPTREDMEAASGLSAQAQSDMIQRMVEGLAERLEGDGSDLDGWIRLARAYVVLGETDKAREALTSARSNFPDDEAAAARIDAAARELGLRS